MNTQMIVVSDDSAVHRVAADIARRRHYDIVCPSSEEEFCDACRRDDPEIVIIDLDFGSDSFSLIGTLSDDHRNIVVVLVGGCDAKTLDAARRVGAKRGLKMGPAFSKPMDVDEAARAIVESLPAHEPRLTRADIERAIAEDEFRLYYQPLVRVANQISYGRESLYGVEALLRWNHPVYGLLHPGRVIPVIEREQMIGAVTRWVAKTACRQYVEWNRRGWDFKLSINVAAEELKDEGFAASIADMTSEAGMSPGHLVLEVTESQVVAEELHSLETLVRLRLQGIELAIDDFGTGYSSLGRLHKLPFNEFKIDKSFVMTACEDKKARDIVRISTDLGHSQEMVVVAEGVSSRDEWNLVSALGCDVAQGFFISKPLPVPEFEAWLASLDEPNDPGPGGGSSNGLAHDESSNGVSREEAAEELRRFDRSEPEPAPERAEDGEPARDDEDLRRPA